MKIYRSVLVIGIMLLGLAVFPASAGASTPPSALNFSLGLNLGTESIQATPGTTTYLHWAAPGPNQYFLISSNFSNFGNQTSPAAVIWPAGTTESWNGGASWWNTTTTSLGLVIPSTATAGTSWSINLYTCDNSIGECSNYNDPGGACGVSLPTYGEVCSLATVTVESGWSSTSYSSAYTATPQSHDLGGDLDSSVDSSGNSWSSSEFSNALGEVPAGSSRSNQYQDPLFVQAGGSITLTWGNDFDWNVAASGDYFLITSKTPDALPNFSPTSTNPPTWGSGSATWNNTYTWYGTTSNQMTITAPASATNGTTYMFQIFTCNSSACSSNPSPSAPPGGTVNLTVAVAPSSVTASTANAPFQSGNASLGTCSSTQVSQDAETVDAYAGGTVWMVLGGGGSGCTSNSSEVVSFNPSHQTFCVYQVPPDNAAVSGLNVMSYGSATIVFLAEQNAQTIGYFNPGLIGDGCNGTKSEYYAAGSNSTGLTACPTVDPGVNPGAPSGCNLVVENPWYGSATTGYPAHISADAASFTGLGGNVWVTDFYGEAVTEVTISNILNGAFTSSVVTLPVHATSIKPASWAVLSQPWQIAQDNSYVYVTDYGDQYISRIDKSTLALSQVQVPVTSDQEALHSLVDVGGTLYFTLADDSEPVSGLQFGYTSDFGAITTSSWAAGSSSVPSTAEVYTGLDAAVGSPIPTTQLRSGSHIQADFRGIAVDSAGDVTLSDLYGTVVLTP